VDGYKPPSSRPQEKELRYSWYSNGIQGDKYNFFRTIPKEEMTPLFGKSFTYKVNLKSNAPGAYIEYFDGINEVKSTPHTGSGLWEVLEVSFTVDPKSKFFRFYPAILRATSTPNPEVKIGEFALLPIRGQSSAEPTPFADLNLALTGPSPTSLPAGWMINQKPETVSFARASNGEMRIVAPTLNFSRPLPETLLGKGLEFQAEIKAPFSVRSAYSDKKTPEISAATKGNGTWETIRFPFKVQDAVSARLFAAYFKTPAPHTGKPVELRNLQLVERETSSLSATTAVASTSKQQ